MKALSEVLDFGDNAVLRDAAIQRFEFTFEAVWKALKLFLEENEGIIANHQKRSFVRHLLLGFLQIEKQKNVWVWSKQEIQRSIPIMKY